MPSRIRFWSELLAGIAAAASVPELETLARSEIGCAAPLRGLCLHAFWLCSLFSSVLSGSVGAASGAGGVTWDVLWAA